MHQYRKNTEKIPNKKSTKRRSDRPEKRSDIERKRDLFRFIRKYQGGIQIIPGALNDCLAG